MDCSPLIDVSRLVDRASQGRLPTGVDRVCLAYISRFGSRAQAVLQWRSWRGILPNGASQDLFALLREPIPDFKARATRVIAAGVLSLRWQQSRGRLYFNHGHVRLQDPGLGAWLRRTGQRPVYMVHDLIPLTHPEYCRPGEDTKHAARMRTVLTGSAGILTNSDHTAQELHRFAAANALPMPPVQTAPIAPGCLQRFEGPPPMVKPYFVILGTIEPRKNHLLLLELWRDLVQRLGSDAPQLVVIGQRGWECENVVDMLERCEALRGVVHELPSCTDQELSHWLGHARALLFPSFAEGYGMPLVESLMLGTPVIASDLPSFHEAAGTVPEYLDPLDGMAWRQAILDYVAHASPRRQAQLLRLHSFRCPTWDDHFELVEEFLERLQ